MKRLTTFLLLCAAASPASAQSLNIDIGSNSLYPLPAPSYGGGANKPGVWNAVPGNASGQALLSLSGSPTAATISTTGSIDFDYNNLATSGNDQNLLDDLQDIVNGCSWTISGLAGGQYQVYTYAWAPDGAAFKTSVSVAGGGLPQVVGGAWTGSHQAGVTYALHTVNVAPGGSITISLAIAETYGSCNGFQLVTNDVPSGGAFCFGDGSGAACPCLNSGAAGRGCANSVDANGGLLVRSGTTSPDTLVLAASGMPATATAVFLQGDANAPSPIPFGDGLRCAAGNLKRLAVKASVNGASQFPAAGDPSITAQSAALGDPIAPGATRYYQTYYRDPSAVFCAAPAGDTWNVTNGQIVVW